MRLICISGKAQHGKDTVANMMGALFQSQGYSVLILHYADLLKHICKDYFYWDGKKDAHGRQLLQQIGTDVIRRKDKDFWVRFVSDFLSFFPRRWDYVIIPDCRFPNEIEYHRNRGLDVEHVRVIRPNFDNGMIDGQKAHVSETALDDYPVDRLIVNDGAIFDLATKVGEMFGEGALCVGA